MSTYTSHILTILPGNYTPATFIDQLQTQFRTITSSFTATLDSNYGAVISANTSNPAYAFKILTDDELSRGVSWYGGSYDRSYPNSANDLINNTIPSKGFIGNSSSWSSGFLNLNWINNVYITSPNLGSFDTIFAGRGDNNIIKKTPISANYGFMNVDQTVAPNDFLDCSKQCLQTLEFHIKTSKGLYIPFHGAHVSFSISFNKFASE